MAEPTLETDIREYRKLDRKWRDHVAQVEIEIYGTVPEAVFSAYVRKEAIERDSELWENYNEIATELEVAKVALEVRMVEAHEILMAFQQKASQS